MIFCQYITVEVPDSTFHPAKILVPTPPTIDNSTTSHNIVQESITLDEEILKNRIPGAYSTLGQSPNQPIIQYSEGSTPHIPPSSPVRISTPIHISDSMAGSGMRPELDKFDDVIDEEALMNVDDLRQETCELREVEVDITKTVMMLDEEEVIHDDKDLEEEEDIGEKTSYDVAEEEEKDVYDPAVLGKMLIHCHLLFLYSFLPSSIYLSFLSIYPSFYPSIYPFILQSYSFHLSINQPFNY